MKRLNGVDALMLYSETPEIHMHTLKVGILDVSGVEDFSFDMFRRVAYP
ncbi:UNVERIFIED_CONTAM: wax ester/triacylglycerol synthase family O-acyltransferase, partial [Bacillus amyloliquefaciens DSM 7 = ATCC 23350]